MISWLAGLLLTVVCLSAGGVMRPVQHLSIAGATGSLAYLRRAVSAFEQEHRGVTVSISGGGSIAGLVEVSRGRVDVGVSDVLPQVQWTRGANLHSRVVGRVPLLIIVHPGIRLNRVSEKTLRDILTGRIVSWRDLGGASTPIVVFTRPLSSGARLIVQEQILKGQPLSRRAVVELSNGAMQAAVQETPGAIGFIEAGAVPLGVAKLDVGSARFRSETPEHWPYAVVPTVYWQAGASSLVRSLALFLTTRPYRHTYGLYPAVR